MSEASKQWAQRAWLLTRAEVLDLTGLDRRELSAAVTAGLVETVRLGRRKRKYTRVSVQRLVGVTK